LQELEYHFKEWFGCKQILWLEYGELEGDDTDAHVDTLARFAPNNTIIYQGCQDHNDSHFAPLVAMARQLEAQTNAEGIPYRLVELPFPSPKYAEDGHRLPATYANFLICNDQVIVPTYQDAEDKNALAAVSDAFPNHIVQGVDALPLIEEHGSIHCITMQLPEGSVNFNANFDLDQPLSG
jgi:agmatine deiminase